MSPHIHCSIECWDQEHSEPFELPPILKKWSCDFSGNCTINRSFKVLSLANSPSAASGVDGPVEEETIYLEFGAWGIGNNNPGTGPPDSGLDFGLDFCSFFSY